MNTRSHTDNGTLNRTNGTLNGVKGPLDADNGTLNGVKGPLDGTTSEGAQRPMRPGRCGHARSGLTMNERQRCEEEGRTRDDGHTDKASGASQN